MKNKPYEAFKLENKASDFAQSGARRLRKIDRLGLVSYLFYSFSLFFYLSAAARFALLHFQ